MPIFKNIIIFGAGSGLEKAIASLNKLGEILYVVDNDPSKWGQIIHSYKIFSPEILKQQKLDGVVIICSWWKKSISRQLTSYGLVSNKDFFLDIIFFLKPDHYFDIFIEFNTFLTQHSKKLLEKKILHLGVGNTLIVDILMVMAGAQVICSNLEDEMIFFPDISPKKNIYSQIRSFYEKNCELFIMPPEAILKNTSTGMLIDTSKVSFQMMNMEALALVSESIDYLFTYDLLEHVAQPKKAISESFRVLKENGIFYHHIHPGDHRSDKPFFDMYTYSQDEWIKICNQYGYHHNRWLSCQFIDSFKNAASIILEATSRISPSLFAASVPGPQEIDVEFQKFNKDDFFQSTGYLTIGGIA